MGMLITKNNIEAAAEILEILAKRKITVRQFGEISGYLTDFLENSLTVKKMDFKSKMLEKFQMSEKDFDELDEN